MQKPNQLSPAATEPRNFLLSKARSEAVPRPVCVVAPDKNAEALELVYPSLLSGKSLLVRAMSSLEDVSEFAAAVVQIDVCRLADGPAGSESEPDIRTTVARTIEKACRSVSGLWGVLDPTAFGCFLPECNPTSTLAWAEEMKKSVAADGGPSVTIGLAFFPTLDYSKDKILDNARKALEHAKFFGPDSLISFDAISLNISGDRLYDEGEYRKAIDEYKTALKLDPANANLHNSLGVCYGVTGEFVNALRQFKEAMALDAEEALAHYNAGLVHLLLDERDKARAHLLEVDNRPHNLFEVRLQLGKLYLEDDQPEIGLIYLEKAAAMQPQSSAVHALIGECCAVLDRGDEAVAAYKKSLRLNADDATSLSGLGWLYHVMGKNADIATLFCRHSTAIAPRNALFHHRLGCLYLKADRLSEARDEFQKAVDLGRDSTAQLAEVQSRLLDKAS